MYKEIGDIFEYQGVTLQVVESCGISCKGCTAIQHCSAIQHCCNDCYFYEIFGPCDTILCSRIERKDNKDVIFKKYNNKK